MASRTVINHWRFEDGTKSPNIDSNWPLDPPPRGWYCWVYPDNDQEFEDWMKANCPTSEVTHRFNSGDPMYTVYLKEDLEAMVFHLRWQ